jgi:hypothetical protein
MSTPAAWRRSRDVLTDLTFWPIAFGSISDRGGHRKTWRDIALSGRAKRRRSLRASSRAYSAWRLLDPLIVPARYVDRLPPFLAVQGPLPGPHVCRSCGHLRQPGDRARLLAGVLQTEPVRARGTDTRNMVSHPSSAATKAMPARLNVMPNCPGIRKPDIGLTTTIILVYFLESLVAERRSHTDAASPKPGAAMPAKWSSLSSSCSGPLRTSIGLHDRRAPAQGTCSLLLKPENNPDLQVAHQRKSGRCYRLPSRRSRAVRHGL